MKTKFFTIVALLAVLSMLATSFAFAQEPSAGKVDEAWYAKAAEPYKGVTIVGVSESTPPSRYAAEVLAPAFEKMTGIKVKFEVTSWDEMYNKEMKDMEAGTALYDFVYLEQDIVYAYMARNFLVDLDQMMKDKPELMRAGFNWDDFVAFANYFKDPKTGHMMGMPMEAFLKTVVYRTDLFDDAKIKEAFKAKYGYELAPAKTFKEYREIAEFFTQYAKDNNMEMWGTVVQAHTGHVASWYEQVESILPAFGVYRWGINMDTWKACAANGGAMNGDRAKEALTWWLDNLKFAPPEATNSTWDEIAGSFAAGRAAMGWEYCENLGWIGRDESKSKVIGKFAVALPPLYEGVLEEAKAGKGYIGYYDGGAYAIPVGSKNKEAAMLWLQYIGDPGVQAGWAVEGSRITLKSTLEDPAVVALDKQLGGYFTFYKEYSPLFAGAPPFPFHATVREVVAPFFFKAIMGELKPADALDQACAAAEEELVREGYGK